jgi:hypothetical protein
MSLDEILGNLSEDQIKSLKDIMSSNPQEVVNFLQIKSDEIDRKVQEKEERKRLEAEEYERKLQTEKEKSEARSRIQMQNAERYLSNFGKVKTEFKTLFDNVISNSDRKDLTTKLHDRLLSILIEYIVIKQYYYAVVDDRYDELLLEDEENSEDFEVLNDFLQNKISNLEDQYRLLSYLYGEQIGISDEKIINKGFILNNYGAFNLYSDIIDKGLSISDALDAVYLNNNNDVNHFCVRNVENMLTYPQSDYAISVHFGNDNSNEFMYFESTIKKYCPFTVDRIEQLYLEIIKPYYDSMQFDFKNKIGTISVIDDYRSDQSVSSDSITFYNKGELQLTQQIINEYMSQKERKNGNSL